MAEREAPKRLVVRQGHVWMSHRQLDMIERAFPSTACEGQLRFLFTHGRLKEVHCDECSFMVATTIAGIRDGVKRRDKLVAEAEFNREAWWQK